VLKVNAGLFIFIVGHLVHIAEMCKLNVFRCDLMN